VRNLVTLDFEKQKQFLIKYFQIDQNLEFDLLNNLVGGQTDL
jgi:hypothetical protein